jgi:PAS domain S-box-containing protein
LALQVYKAIAKCIGGLKPPVAHSRDKPMLKAKRITRSEPAPRERLRRRAEALLKKSPHPGSRTPAADAQKVVHELGVHQVELEMQNEELRRTELELMRSRDRFSDLYDFAPVGYLTINLEGTVLEANLTAAKMLGVVRNQLVAQPFSRFIEHDSQDSFYRHRRAAFSSGKPGTCELVLRRADRTGLPVHLESLPVTGDAARIRQCRIALVDVTELKRTEAALREARDSLEEKVRLRTAALDAANEQLEHLLGSSPAIIYSSKPSGDYAGVFISKNVREQLGYEAQEFMEDPGFWAGHIHPEDKPAVFARLAAISKQGRLSLEYRFRHKDGTYRWMRDDVTLVKNSAGRPQQIVGCWMDVTERRQAEEGRAQLAAIVESSEDAIISRTLDDLIISWNLGAERLLGWSAAEIVGRSYSLLVPPECAEDLQRTRQRILRGEGVECYETVRLTRNGRKVEVSCTNSPVKDDRGQVVGMASILRNISRQKWAEAASRQSEQALADFFTEAPIGLLWVARDGRILRANQALGAMLGCYREDLFGRQVAEFCLDPEVVLAMVLRLARQESLHDNLVRLQRNDRSLLHVLIDANGLWEKGKLVQSRWFVRDITRRMELEKEILAVSDRERQRIGQDLHDDLCQQLTSIEFLTRALERKLQANSRAEGAQAKEIGQLTRRAITHARELAHGMFPVELHASGLTGALRDLASRTKALFRIDCRFRGESSPHIHDQAAQIHLYRITQEAVRNAVRHGKAGQIVIGLKTGKSRIVLSVRDNGSGFPLKPPKSQGLGLRIMDHRASVLGGAVLVRKSPKGGTTVVCSIPAPLP